MRKEPKKVKVISVSEVQQSGRVPGQYIVIRTLNVCKDACVSRYDAHYHPRHRHGHIHLVLDTVMVMVIVLLAAGVVGFMRVSSPLAPLMATPHTSVRIPTELAAVAVIRLTTLEGEPLWAGPLPPVVGRETRLRVFFDVVGFKSTHRNFVLTAEVVASVIPTDRAVANHGVLVSKDRAIRWELGNVRSDTAAQANVELSFTPTAQDVGRSLTLMARPQLFGKDTGSDSPVRIELSDVTTATLPNTLGIVTN